MKVGSDNEFPTAEKFSKEDFVTEFYDVGLLQSKEYPYLGVSPDGIAKIRLGNDSPYACVEIKTRSRDATIAKAEAAAKQHGRIVKCAFEDTVFDECVLRENQNQVLHQAFVTGLLHGVYVVAKVEEGYGQIVQIVICTIKKETIDKHKRVIVNIGKPLLP